MGNHQSLSCFFCFTTSPSSNPPTSSYLLDSQGEKHHHHHHHHQRVNNAPTTAAEIMLEAPGCIVSSADDMRRTGRVTAMKADDVLLAGKTYLVVPLSRINCKVSEREMEMIAGLELEEKVHRSWKGFGGRRRRSSRISPAVVVQEGEESKEEEFRHGDDDGVGFCSQKRVCDGNNNNNNNRRWSPVLEPILE